MNLVPLSKVNSWSSKEAELLLRSIAGAEFIASLILISNRAEHHRPPAGQMNCLCILVPTQKLAKHGMSMEQVGAQLIYEFHLLLAGSGHT